MWALLGDNGSGKSTKAAVLSYTLQVAPNLSALPTRPISSPERDNGHALLLGEE